MPGRAVKCLDKRLWVIWGLASGLVFAIYIRVCRHACGPVARSANGITRLALTRELLTIRDTLMPPNTQQFSQLSWQRRLQLVFAPPVLCKACIVACLVGSLLILLNQGDLLFSGQITPRLLTKSLLTPMIPFCVTLLGAFLNSGSAALSPSLGWPAIRRSLMIAVLVGSTIIMLNQGDVLWAGAVTPRVWLKVAVTPCVPFCVSLYGAYVMAKNARQREGTLATHLREPT